MTATETVESALVADGWSLESTNTDPGGPDKPSVWSVTIKRNGRGYTTTYTMGAAHRRWKKHQPDRYSLHSAFKEMGGKPLARVPQGTVKSWLVDSYNAHTEPTPPDLAGVLYCLASDAGSVRHGQTFDEWCGDFGMDTDSIKALNMFNACRDTWSSLARLGADFDKLDGLFVDF